ncbi:MAG: hypothetical protein WDM77_00750 [Steroidobacteraceae bacterium]
MLRTRPAQRARAFAELPNWTGIWETEAAERLLSSGAPQFEPPKLWGKPPYSVEWEKHLAGAHPQGGPPPGSGSPPGALELPPTAKVCSPGGFPAVMEYPVPDYLFELLVTPEETLLLATDGAARHIYTDGRSHPVPDELWPTSMGDSIGHWEDKTLIIDTIARKAGPVGPPWTADLSDRARFTERLRLLDADTMQDDLAIDDPARFSHPWQITIRYRRVKDISRLVSIDCAENDRNPVIDGKIIISPP